MTKPSAIVTKKSVTMIADAKTLVIPSTNPSYEKVVLSIQKGDYDKALSLMSAAIAVREFSEGEIEIRDNGRTLWYRGEKVEAVLTQRIRQSIESGESWSAYRNFLVRLMQNPTKHSVDQLFRFLQHRLPITTKGTFLAYKYLAENYKDVHTGTILNEIGTFVSMKREDVCHDPHTGCAAGLHAGALPYVTGYGRGQRVVIVEIDPADVVSVPTENNSMKIRVARYRVLWDWNETELKHGIVDLNTESHLYADPKSLSKFLEMGSDDFDTVEISGDFCDEKPDVKLEKALPPAKTEKAQPTPKAKKGTNTKTPTSKTSDLDHLLKYVQASWARGKTPTLRAAQKSIRSLKHTVAELSKLAEQGQKKGLWKIKNHEKQFSTWELVKPR